MRQDLKSRIARAQAHIEHRKKSKSYRRELRASIMVVVFLASVNAYMSYDIYRGGILSVEDERVRNTPNSIVLYSDVVEAPENSTKKYLSLNVVPPSNRNVLGA